VQPSRSIWRDVLGILVGLGGLVLGAQWLVAAASEIARTLGVSDVVIGLTLVAIGTSLPEVATSLVAVYRGKSELAVGNVVGSNLFNLLAIAGITAMVSPLNVPSGMELDFGVMILLTILVWVFSWGQRAHCTLGGRRPAGDLHRLHCPARPAQLNRSHPIASHARRTIR
jgi:cation:H+ antiporter